MKDVKQLSGKIIMVALLFAAAYGFYVFLLPILLAIVWQGITLIIGIIVAAFLLFIIMNGKFWRALRYLCEFIAQWTLGLMIEMNPWQILLLQVEQAQKDREMLNKYAEKLKVQQVEKSRMVEDKLEMLKQSAAEMGVLKARCNENLERLSDEDMLLYETASTNFTNAKTFVDSVQPIVNDLFKLQEYAEKCYRKSGVQLMNQKSTIETQRATFEAVTTGNSVMQAALKAFTGKSELNDDAQKALEVIKKKVAGEIAGIQHAIKTTSISMRANDLNDAAKIKRAAEVAQRYVTDENYNYGTTAAQQSATAVKMKPETENKFNQFLK